MKKIIFLFLAILIISSCNKKEESISSLPQSPTFTSESFPLKIGNWWKYQVINSSTGFIDTMLITIIDSNEIKNYSLLKVHWINYKFNDTSNYRFNKSAFWFDISDYNYLFHIYLHFPFTLNSTWLDSLRPIIRTPYIVNDYIENFEILGNNYNVFKIEMNYIIPNEKMNLTFYLAAGIGIVQEDILGDEPYPNRIIKLIEYHLE